MPPVRVALFGAGWIMDKHAQGVLDHGGASLVAATSWREPSLSALGGRFGIERLTTRWEDLVEDPSVDHPAVHVLGAGEGTALEQHDVEACAGCGQCRGCARRAGSYDDDVRQR